VPSPTSPRNPLTRARFLLAQAEALSGDQREAFDTYLQAAIVFGRAIYHHLQTVAQSSGVDTAYRQWFTAKSAEMKTDPVLEYFRESRDLLLKERQVTVRRRVFGTASAAAYISEYAEGRVTRGEPWYRRSLGILWQDATATVMRPVHRWRYRLVEAIKQQWTGPRGVRVVVEPGALRATSRIGLQDPRGMVRAVIGRTEGRPSCDDAAVRRPGRRG